MYHCGGFWTCVSPDAWITSGGTLIGAFLGALIAGLITLRANKKMIVWQERLRTRDKDDYFKIISQQFIDQFELIHSKVQVVIDTNFDKKISKEVGHYISSKINTIDSTIDIKQMNPGDYKVFNKLLEGYRYISYELVYMLDERSPNLEVMNIIKTEMENTLKQLKNTP
ncbi:hypothetical protein [Halobacillus naozhouensis]|uniref:Uncharacterized protein n=1 Tax=Halobacillus naozhouensis TaxID=554880 RepID=A0ABY8IYN6_9BACI|nr:hypothetical protein [Halobacillus naozhouensis]WFT75344.1 hypothetical protein P9989_02815 [Halobacillus naozhouensis]